MRSAPHDAPAASEPAFTTAYARSILASACHVAGADATDAELLRLGENATFRLAGQSRSVVVRIARRLARLPVAERELCVSRWLNGTGGGVLSTRVHEGVPRQPLVVDGHPVTFWRAVDSDGTSPTAADLARLLRRLHAYRDSPCSLPRFDPVPEIRRRLDTGLDLPETDQDLIRSRCDVLDSLLPALAPALPPGPIHGDATPGTCCAVPAPRS